MATSITKFKGGKELQDMLNTLPARIERNIIRSAIRQGAKVIEEEAKRRVPVNSGDLRDSIRVSTRSRRGQAIATIKAGDENAFYAHMVEFGTAPHWITIEEGARLKRMTRRGLRSFGIKTLNQMAGRGSLVIGTNFIGASVAHPGARAKPFMRPAIDEKQDEAIRAVGEQIRKRLTKEGLNAPPPLEIDED